jgi:uncharacterized protein YkwD
MVALVAMLAACDSELLGFRLHPGDPPPAEMAEFMSLVNQHRAAVGCGPLLWHSASASTAYNHSRDMAHRGYFGHVSPDGTSLRERLLSGGVRVVRAGENLAAGQREVSAAFDAWLRSPPHRSILEDCKYSHQGMGEYQHRWTHILLIPD